MSKQEGRAACPLTEVPEMRLHLFYTYQCLLLGAYLQRQGLSKLQHTLLEAVAL